MTIGNARAVLMHLPTITELGGGMTNKIYKIEFGNDAYVLRVFGQGTDILGINREREVACSKAIAAAGLGADVVAYLPELNPSPFPEFCGALLVRFLPGRLLHRNDVTTEMLSRIGKTLKACHQTPIDDSVAEFSVFKVIPDYLNKAREHNVDLPAAWDDALARLQRIENEVAIKEPPCLCHNDLLAGNFVDHCETLRIIDWEYGGRGNRYFDLGNFATNLQLTDEEEQVLLQAYFGEVSDANVRRVNLMRVVSDLREAAWGFLQQAISKLGAPQGYASYHAYGTRHLKRALDAAATMNL